MNQIMPEEIKQELKHFTKESLVEFASQRVNNTFIVIHGNVYDVTTFVERVSNSFRFF